jgi:hypothetical protein
MMMLRKEINERSPLRVLEQSIHGGLGRGNIGVVLARHGVGKTAFLVGVALDELMRGNPVLHVSLEQSVDRVLAYYDEIFNDLAHKRELEDVWHVRLEMERKRRIHSYLGGTFSTAKLRQALAFKRETSDFTPATIMIDDYDFEQATQEELDALREIARDADAELWMSAVIHRDSDRDPRGVPEPLAPLSASLDVILEMAHDGGRIQLGLLKDHDNPDVSDLKLALDPTTMLLVRDR